MTTLKFGNLHVKVYINGFEDRVIKILGFIPKDYTMSFKKKFLIKYRSEENEVNFFDNFILHMIKNEYDLLAFADEDVIIRVIKLRDDTCIAQLYLPSETVFKNSKPDLYLPDFKLSIPQHDATDPTNLE